MGTASSKQDESCIIETESMDIDEDIEYRWRYVIYSFINQNSTKLLPKEIYEIIEEFAAKFPIWGIKDEIYR